MRYPVMSVDGFYKNPDAVRELALSTPANYQQNIPVRRSNFLNLIAPDFYHCFAKKLLSLFAPIDNIQDYNIGTFFQWMDKKPTVEPFSTDGCGGIHQDDSHCKYAGVIYLSPTITPHSGTSIFTPKDTVTCNFNHMLRLIDPIQYKKDKDEFESKFELSVDVKNVYNRLAGFDSSLWHRANNFYDESSDERLVQVFFIYDFGTLGKTPIDRLNDSIL